MFRGRRRQQMAGTRPPIPIPRKESQAVKAISMPEYRFQDYVTTELFSYNDRSLSEE